MLNLKVKVLMQPCRCDAIQTKIKTFVRLGFWRLFNLKINERSYFFM